ncbi:MAG: hypothetical protein OXF28_03780 [Thaumarchaeota archaeon]|nr:hypothetical protein [Nitrososphaerota archaeon]MCY3976232.1 hypothetical protein [Nitrososphaerota archaeon]
MKDFDTFLNMMHDCRFPVGIGGCKNNKHNFDCCEYNITIFNNCNHDFDHAMKLGDDTIIKIHYGNIKEARSNILILYNRMKIINDPNWDLKIFLSKLHQNINNVSQDFIKNCLINSFIYSTKTKICIERHDPLSVLWQKCSVLFLLDALLIINSGKLSPTHILKYVRDFQHNKINSHFSIINDCIGIERATTSLLSRMYKSTLCLNTKLQKKDSKIIQTKYNYMIKNSLLSDCYLYLMYINRNYLIEMKNKIHSNNVDIYYMLKNGFDIDNDKIELHTRIKLVQNTADYLLREISNSGNFL